MLNPWIIFLPAIIGVIGFLLYWIATLAQDLVNRDGGHSRRFGEFMKARRDAGLTYHDAMDELYMREQLARVRREASDAIWANPALWFEALKKAKDDAYERVAAERPNLMPVFAPWLGGLGYQHVFYPDEVREVERQMVGESVTPFDADRFAALKIAR